VTTDTELETWQQEWRDQTEPLPDLKRKIRRQNLRTAGAVVAICLCLAVSTIAARRNHSWFLAGMAAGIGFAGVFMGSYAWWVRRGAWRPTAQTTLAYAELSHKRAIAKVRTLHFAFYFLLATTVLLAGFVAWNAKNFHVRDGAILAAIVVELFFLKYYGRRKQREIEETKKVIDDLKE
jgi:uncharacterized membrane protein YozB (DUF420 family)